MCQALSALHCPLGLGNACPVAFPLPQLVFPHSCSHSPLILRGVHVSLVKGLIPWRGEGPVLGSLGVLEAESDCLRQCQLIAPADLLL